MEREGGAGRAVDVGVWTGRRRVRILGKRSPEGNPRTEEVPESKERRIVFGLDVCQEAEQSVLEPDTVTLQIELEDESLNEIAVGSSPAAPSPCSSINSRRPLDWVMPGCRSA